MVCLCFGKTEYCSECGETAIKNQTSDVKREREGFDI